MASSRSDTDAVAAGVLDLLALGDAPDLDTVLQRIVRAARRQSNARYGAIGVPDGRGGFARFVTSGISERVAATIGELPRTHGVLGALLEEGPILLDDIRSHPRFSYYPAHHPTLTDFLGVPIKHRGRVVGNLFVSGHRAGHFTKADARKLETLAAYAGVAIANAELYARSQRLAVVEERNRVARELHDAATQTLFSLVLAARAAALSTRDDEARETIRGFEQRTTSALQELRGLVHALRPKSLERDGLAATLADHAEALRTSGARVVVDADEGVRLPLETEHALLRIAQEALNNALRHAPGASVRVTLRPGTKAVTLRIHDDGPGFDEGALPHTRRGMGLATMRERAHEIGAQLDIRSHGRNGTSVTVKVPTG
ncbi:MAG: GAF domain-containing sensor histidine kinase [Candidatus Dormiibacterota bacterium]